MYMTYMPRKFFICYGRVIADKDTARDGEEDELGGGDSTGDGSTPVDMDRAGKQRADNARAAAKPAGYRNPMFHNANGNAETEVAR